MVVGDEVERGPDEVGEWRVLDPIVRRAGVIAKATVEQLLHVPQCWELCPWLPPSSPRARREGGACPGRLSRKRLGA